MSELTVHMKTSRDPLWEWSVKSRQQHGHSGENKILRKCERCLSALISPGHHLVDWQVISPSFVSLDESKHWPVDVDNVWCCPVSSLESVVSVDSFVLLSGYCAVVLVLRVPPGQHVVPPSGRRTGPASQSVWAAAPWPVWRPGPSQSYAGHTTHHTQDGQAGPTQSQLAVKITFLVSSSPVKLSHQSRTPVNKTC